MSSQEHVVLFPTFDGVPEVQAEIPSLWSPYGLQVALRSPVAAEADYEEWLEGIGEEIARLAEEGDVDLAGNSNGGKIALSLLARHPDAVRRVMICNTKIGPYAFSNPKTRERLPNLAKTSDILADDMKIITQQMLGRVLCFHSENDEVLDRPEDAILEGAHNLVTPTNTHAEGVEHVATQCGLVIAQFFQEGIVPKVV